MDNSFDGQESRTQLGLKRFLMRLPILGDIIRWLASLIQWTEDEEEQAGIYLDHPGGE